MVRLLLQISWGEGSWWEKPWGTAGPGWLTGGLVLAEELWVHSLPLGTP